MQLTKACACDFASTVPTSVPCIFKAKKAVSFLRKAVCFSWQQKCSTTDAQLELRADRPFCYSMNASKRTGIIISQISIFQN